VVPAERPEDFVRRVTRCIAALRQARGMTQDQLAEVLGTATRNVRRIEAGQNLTLYTLARVARVLGVRPDDLLMAGTSVQTVAAEKPPPRRARRTPERR
jgi:transcriptional regulator with XRE-family HTH domain